MFIYFKYKRLCCQSLQNKTAYEGLNLYSDKNLARSGLLFLGNSLQVFVWKSERIIAAACAVLCRLIVYFPCTYLWYVTIWAR